MTHRFITNPWTNSHGHSLAVESNGGKTLYIAGLTAGPDDAPDFESQAKSCFKSISNVLTSNGYTPADLVKLNIYVVGDHDYGVVEKQINEMFPNSQFPAGTMVRVAGLAIPQILIEVEGIAVSVA